MKCRRRLSGGENRRAAGQSRETRTGSLSQTLGQRDVLLHETDEVAVVGRREVPHDASRKQDGFVQQHFERSDEGRGRRFALRARERGEERAGEFAGDRVVGAVGRSRWAECEARHLSETLIARGSTVTRPNAGDEIHSSARAVSRQRRVPERLVDDFQRQAAHARVAVRYTRFQERRRGLFLPETGEFARDEHPADRLVPYRSAQRRASLVQNRSLARARTRRRGDARDRARDSRRRARPARRDEGLKPRRDAGSEPRLLVAQFPLPLRRNGLEDADPDIARFLVQDSPERGVERGGATRGPRRRQRGERFSRRAVTREREAHLERIPPRFLPPTPPLDERTDIVGGHGPDARPERVPRVPRRRVLCGARR